MRRPRPDLALLVDDRVVILVRAWRRARRPASGTSPGTSRSARRSPAGCRSATRTGRRTVSGWPSRNRWVVLPPFSYMAPSIRAGSRRSSIHLRGEAYRTGSWSASAASGEAARGSPAVTSLRQPVDGEDLIARRPDQAARAPPRARVDGVDAADERVHVQARGVAAGSAESPATCRRRRFAVKAEPAGPARQSRDRLGTGRPRRTRTRRSRCCPPRPRRGEAGPSAAGSGRGRMARGSRRRRSPRAGPPGNFRCPGRAGGPGRSRPRKTIVAASARGDRIELEVVAAEDRAGRPFRCSAATRRVRLAVVVEPDDGVLADSIGVEVAADQRQVVHVEAAGKKRDRIGTRARSPRGDVESLP